MAHPWVQCNLGLWLPFSFFLNWVDTVFYFLFFWFARFRRRPRYLIPSFKTLKSLLSLLLFAVTGKGSPSAGPIHFRLSRWWLPGESSYTFPFQVERLRMGGTRFFSGVPAFWRQFVRVMEIIFAHILAPPRVAHENRPTIMLEIMLA